ncbi:MAG: hypothetical protein U0894_16290 [Pirellulales bacterium]
MQGRLANSFNALERQKRRQQLWHRFHSLLVAVSVCLLMLLAVVRRPQGYVAVVSLQGEGEGSTPASVESWLRSPDVVQTAMQNCLVGAGKSRITSVGKHEDLATFRQRFQVVASSQAHESPYLEVEFTASTPSQSTTVLQRLAYSLKKILSGHDRRSESLPLMPSFVNLHNVTSRFKRLVKIPCT